MITLDTEKMYSTENKKQSKNMINHIARIIVITSCVLCIQLDGHIKKIKFNLCSSFIYIIPYTMSM